MLTCLSFTHRSKFLPHSLYLLLRYQSSCFLQEAINHSNVCVWNSASTSRRTVLFCCGCLGGSQLCSVPWSSAVWDYFRQERDHLSWCHLAAHCLHSTHLDLCVLVQGKFMECRAIYAWRDQIAFMLKESVLEQENAQPHQRNKNSKFKDLEDVLMSV